MDEARVVATLRSAGCVFAEEEASLLIAHAADDAELSRLVARRVAGEPLEQIVGWAEFAGLRIAVAPGLFVPRRRTQLMASLAITAARGASARRTVVVDLCCGVGAVGLVIATQVAHTELYSSDLDAAAAECARANLSGLAAGVYCGDLFDPLPEHLRGRVDVLVANAPYVPTEAIAGLPPEARDHENHLALDGGRYGLDIIRRIAAGAPSWLTPGGTLFVETSDEQAAAAAAAFAHNGLEARVECDEDLAATVVAGRAPLSLPA